jgi:hypothetical protein
MARSKERNKERMQGRRERQATAIDGAVEKKKANTKRMRDSRAAQKVAPVPATDAGVPYEEEEDGGADEGRVFCSWLPGLVRRVGYKYVYNKTIC